MAPMMDWTDEAQFPRKERSGKDPEKPPKYLNEEERIEGSIGPPRMIIIYGIAAVGLEVARNLRVAAHGFPSDVLVGPWMSSFLCEYYV